MRTEEIDMWMGLTPSMLTVSQDSMQDSSVSFEPSIEAAIDHRICRVWDPLIPGTFYHTQQWSHPQKHNVWMHVVCVVLV